MQKTQKDTLEAYRSGMKLGVLGVVVLLLLTGCASSPSLEDQASLIEYEACLAKQERMQAEVAEVLFRENDLNSKLRNILDNAKPDPNTGLIKSLDGMIKQCEMYRP